MSICQNLGQMELSVTDLAREMWKQDAPGSIRKAEFCQHEKDFHHCLQKAGEGQTANHSVGIPAPCQQLGWDGAQRGTGMGSMWTGFFGSMEGLNFTWILFCRLRVTNSRSRCVSKASVWCGSSPQLSMNWWLSNPSTPMPNLLWGTQKWVRERADAYYEQLENLPLSILWERYKCKLFSCHCF